MEKKIKDIISKLPEKDQENIKKILSDKDKLLNYLSQPVNTMAILQTENKINSLPKNGILISKKGIYKLSSNLNWSPMNGIPAISIQGEGITLDLNGFSISCQDNNSKGHYGIHIYRSKNISVKNGVIDNMNIHGILVDTSKNIDISNIQVSGLTNNDLNINPSGILTMACENVQVSNAVIGPINSIGVNLSGIQINLTKNSVITNCIVKDIKNNDGVSTGIGHFLSKKIKIYDTEVKGLETLFNGHNFGGHVCIGFFPFLSEGLEIERCNIKNVVGSCDDAHGMSMFLCKGVQLYNCSVENVSSGSKYEKCAKATGIEIYGSNMKIKDCKVKKIHTFNPENKQCTGFSSAQGKNITFINCQAEDVRVYNDKDEESTEFGFGYGFGWAPDPRDIFVKPAYNVLYKKCKAIKCQVGFDSFFHINSVWDSVTSIDNDIPIITSKNNIRNISCDPCSECPQPFTNSIKNVAKGNKFLKLKILFGKQN